MSARSLGTNTSCPGQQSLKDESKLHHALFENAPDALVILDRAMAVVDANPTFADLLGYSREEVRELHAWDWDAKFTREELQTFGRSPEFGTRAPLESLFRRKDGSPVPVEIHARGIDWRGQGLAICSVRDISERKTAERVRREREELHAAMIEQASVGVVLMDGESLCCVEFNDVACGMLGYDREEFARLRLPDFNAQWGSNGLDTNMAKLVEDGQGSFETVHRAKDGSLVDTLVSARIIEIQGRAHGLIFWTDISERKRAEKALLRQREELHRLAFFDSLTGLPNRALLQDRIQQEAIKRQRRGGLFALMVLDIDNFKDINDTLGHAAGDRLLSEIARRLSDCLHGYATLSRLGGDEFAVLLPDIYASQDMGAVARLILDELIKPFSIEGRDVFSSASIGIAVYPDDSLDIGGLFACADMAMYHAKDTGRNTFQFYDARLTEAAQARLSLGTALRHALARGELEVFYQPKVSMPEGRVLGAEALLRWNHPEMGLLSPDSLMGMAEDTGLIVDIGHWVLQEACAAVARWNLSRTDPLHVAVNLSSRQFVQGDLAASVRQALASSGCQGSWLELEITESIMLQDNPGIQGILETLGGMGASIAIDDFGTGHSSLSYLSQFRVDVLKIDRSFVAGVEHDRRKAELVKAFIAVARALGMGLVAEGVELPEQVDFLCANGCCVAQGYLYGKPTPLEAFERLLHPMQNA